MSHNVETMAYVGETPWHGLGNVLSPGQSLDVWKRQAGMDWSIRSSPVHYLTQSIGGFTGDLLDFSEHKVLYRSDTNKPLSVVGHKYHVVQPEEVLEFYRDLTEYSGFQLETAGVLKGGRKLWALAKTGYDGELKGRDRINGYVLLATACDGSMATTVQFTSIRVVCQNTLSVSLREGAQHHAPCVKVRHNTRFDADAVKRQLGISVGAWSDFMYELKGLSQRPFTEKEAETFLQQLMVPASSPNPEKANRRSINRALALYQGQGRGSLIESAHGTAFGLLNAVTEFVDYERRAISKDHRLDAAWFGAGAQLKDKAFQQLLELV